MKRNIQSTRSPLLASILAGVASASFAAAALAAGVGVGVGAGASVGAGAQVNAPGQAQAGGSADAHMSTSGSTNTNAQWRDGTVRGADRAAERMKGEAATELEAAGRADASATRAPAR